MKQIFSLITVLFTLTLVPKAVSAMEISTSEFSSAAGNQYRVDDSNNGQSVRLRRGDRLEVRLDFQGGVPYIWEVVRNNSQILAQVGKPTTESKYAHDGPVVGQTEVRVFRFEARSRGRNYLQLNYARPFGDHSISKTWHLYVNVH